MTQAMKCQHDGETITGWDEVTCKKCGWIVPSGQRMGIHDGWFPSHDAHKEFKKYRTYTGMDNTYPIDATKYDEVQNMTQTNNEREVIELNDIALKQQSEAWLAVFHVLNEVKPNWLDSNLPAMGCAVNAIKELAKSPISQNEQPKQIPEDVIKDAERYRWLKINEQVDVALCVWVDDDLTSEGGYYSEIIDYLIDEEMDKAMINASPTTSLTSETNTEVGE